MKKLRFLLPTLLILALAGSVAVAQTFSRAIQLSQDTSGAFLVDSNNNLYLPTKLMFPTGLTSSPAPTITGTGTPTIAGTDTAGLVTMGASATTATAVFGRAYGATPNCVVAWQGPITTATPMAYTTTTTRIAITQGATSGNLINYFCTGTTS